jgi:hypothetical protein
MANLNDTDFVGSNLPVLSNQPEPVEESNPETNPGSEIDTDGDFHAHESDVNQNVRFSDSNVDTNVSTNDSVVTNVSQNDAISTNNRNDNDAVYDNSGFPCQ